VPIITVKKCLNCNVDHEWIFDGATLRELRVIKQITGMNQADFSAAGDNGDPEALAALLYVLHLRDKIRIPFEDVDLDFKNFAMEATEEEKAAIAEWQAKNQETEAPKAENGQTKKAASKHKS
jgi:uncharacterized sporulation protein YeaH/YhbH (DUF444 family)